MPGSMSVDGIISGLNTQDIIDKLTEMRKSSIKQLQDKQARLTTQLTAWQDLNVRLLSLKMKSDAMANPNTFGAKTVTTSDDSILTATANSSATPGTYYVTVKTMAMAHQIQSRGYDSLSDTLGTGTLNITVGGKTTSVTIDSNSSSLVGVKDAINRAGAGVKAAIVDTGAATGRYKLVVTSNTTGKANSITMDTSGLTGGSAPTFTDLQAADDATIQLGSGAGAIQITNSSNNIKDFLPGIALNIKSADPNKVLTLDVQQDTDSIHKAVSDFVDQYNDIVDFMRKQFSYDPQTKTAGDLFGDFSLQTVQMDLASVTMNPVSDLSQTLRALAQVGVTSDSTGKLHIGGDLDKFLADSPDQVKALFSQVGSATDPNVQFVAATSDTRATSAGYSVEVTRLATRSRMTAGVEQTQALSADEKLTINGTAVSLSAGWTQQQVVDAINAQTANTGVTASLTDISGQGTGNYLTLTSQSYGSSSDLSVRSSRSNGGTTPEYDTSGFGSTEVKLGSVAGESGTGTGQRGWDVLGKINGEMITGSGQMLTGATGDAKGLSILVTGGATGSRGAVTYTRGVGSLLSNYLSAITDKNGAVTTSQNTLNSQISDIGSEITDMNDRLQKKQDQLYQQFQAMEDALSKLKDQGSAISSLLASK